MLELRGYLHCPSLSPHPSVDQRPKRQNVVYWLQPTIQYNVPPTAHPQTSPPGTQQLPVQLNSKFPDHKQFRSAPKPPAPLQWTSCSPMTAELHPALISSSSLQTLTTAVMRLINNNNETIYWSEVSRLALCCKDNNLYLIVENTKEIILDFRREHAKHNSHTNTTS